MATDFKAIPMIDISPLLAKCNDHKMGEYQEVCETVSQIDKACKEAGFFYVRGHGIPDSLMKEVRELSRKFFELPCDEKNKIKLTASSGYRGYQSLGVNITKGVLDKQEAIDYYKEFNPGAYGDLGKVVEGSNLWPLDPPKFKESMKEYINLCTDLSRNIMRGIALALGGEPYEFEGNKAGNAFWYMRIIGYPGKPAYKNNQCVNDIGCGAHTDYGLLTLINQDENISALEVKNLSGDWISAPPIPGTFVCNIGDMLKIYTNGLYESTLHRVTNNSPLFRTSVAYFYEPNFDSAVEPLDVCKQRMGGAKKFNKAVYGEHLVSKVLANYIL